MAGGSAAAVHMPSRSRLAPPRGVYILSAYAVLIIYVMTYASSSIRYRARRVRAVHAARGAASYGGKRHQRITALVYRSGSPWARVSWRI